MSVIIACFAEVASRFHQAGGPYLYARVAFGRLMGIQTAWMLWLGQVAAPAANANLICDLPGRVLPARQRTVTSRSHSHGAGGPSNLRQHSRSTRRSPDKQPLYRRQTNTAIRRDRSGFVRTSAPSLEHRNHAHRASSTSQWLKAMLLLVFAYGGFETALAPMSEAKDPRRDAPFALFTALALCTVTLRADPMGSRRSSARRRAQPAPAGRCSAHRGRPHRRRAGRRRRADFFLRISQRKNPSHAPRSLRPGRARRLPQSLRGRPPPAFTRPTSPSSSSRPWSGDWL